MNIELWCLGKEKKKNDDVWTQDYVKRINHYIRFNIHIIDNSKISVLKDKNTILEAEATLIKCKLKSGDLLICLDEKGKKYSSLQFAKYVEQTLNISKGRIIFLIGGSFGISSQLKENAFGTLTLSDFTFPHILVRLIFCEQLYRAFSIIHNEKYHHE